jgi:perosamine synthetase
MKIGLIPRYNWDYSIRDFVFAVYGAAGGGQKSFGAVEKRFGKDLVFINSGRSALYSILKALNLPSGAMVGVPLFCCPVVFEAIVKSGNTPVFIDIGSRGFNISIADKKLRSGELSAVVAVDMFGNPADIVGLKNTCGPEVTVIQDCAQSLFSPPSGDVAGCQSEISFYSFRSGKYMSIGEGGMIVCRNPQIRKQIINLVDTLPGSNFLREIISCFLTYIKSCFYRRPLYGAIGLPVGRILDVKLNLTGKSGFSPRKILKSALYLVQLKLPGFQDKINKQIENSLLLVNEITDKSLFLMNDYNGETANWYQFPLCFGSEKRRDEAHDMLLKQGVDSAKYLDDVVATAAAEFGYTGDCLIAEERAKATLCIPNHYTLKQKDLEKICRAVNSL